MKPDHTEWHPLLKCGLRAVSYIVRDRCAVLCLPVGHCVDFHGAIEYVLGLWPDAIQIETIAGNRLDMCYARTKRGEWGMIYDPTNGDMSRRIMVLDSWPCLYTKRTWTIAGLDVE